MSKRRCFSLASTAQRTDRRDRRGFTLVELMVAIMIMNVGVLSLASAASLVTRHLSAAKRQAVATQVAQSRLEWLHATSCGSLRDSSTVTRGISESWTKTNLTKAVKVVTSVQYLSLRRINNTQSYTTIVPCV
jgi:prepilin-type N-terminal cleavage/methylation domain-containing protein